MAVKPTPTQEENDRAAMGEHVIEKEADGSTEEAVPPPVGAAPPDPEPKTEHHKKQMEAERPARQAGYQTRAAAPAQPRTDD